MTANINPIYAKEPHVEWSGALTAANTSKDLSSGTVNLLFTAGADGDFIESITAKALGTNVASVARIFLNNGSATTTAANNVLISEISLPATTLTEVAGLQDVAIALNRRIPAGYKLYVLLGTAVAAGWNFTAWAGKY
jgi:hypothetical protein